jgi:hypothetical protein
MKQLITLTLIILSMACFGQAKKENLKIEDSSNITAFKETKKKDNGVVIYGEASDHTPKWETYGSKGTIELPADIQKKLVSLDSVIQSVNKQYREIVEPLQKQQQLIFEMAFSFKGVDVNKVDSVKYNKGIITYKVKQK